MYLENKMFKVLVCLLCFYLTGCQMAMDLAPVINREDRVDVSLGENKGRPIAYDSAVIELKRGTTYIAYPYWRWSFDNVNLTWLDQCNVSLKNRFSASTEEWSTGESAFGGWDSEASVFVEAPLKELGYDVVSHQKSAFRQNYEKHRSELLLSAHIKEIKSNICNLFNILYFKDVDLIAGNATILVHWEVFDKLKDEVVATFDTYGMGVVEKPTKNGEQLILLRALEDATDNLARMEGFIQLVRGQSDVRQLLKMEKEQTAIEVKIKKPRTKMLYENATLLKRAVVQVGDDGTGFFISPDGYILTNLKNVGNAKMIEIVDSHGVRQSAKIIRRNERLNVALLKIDLKNHAFLDVAGEEIPKALKEVFTIGNPADYTARSTLARGMVSSWRFKAKKDQHFIQASIPTTQGYAGAPLMDEYGHVLGIHDGRNLDETSFSYFIPIHDVLRALKIQLKQD